MATFRLRRSDGGSEVRGGDTLRSGAEAPDVTVDAGHASGTGTAYGASINIQPNAGLASGTGTAYNATASSSTNEARVSQEAIEALVVPNTASARVSQVAVEVLRRTNSEGIDQVIIVG